MGSLDCVFAKLMSQQLSLEDISGSRDVMTAKCVNEYIQECATSSGTSKVWAQYIELVEIVPLYIMAERSGD